MGIALHRFPKFHLELYVYSGAVAADEVMRHYKRLDPSFSWLSYFATGSDLTAIDMACLPAMKRTITATEEARRGDLPRRHALVNVPRRNEAFVRFWCDYAPAGVPYAHRRDMFADLAGACRWLGLPGAACQAVCDTISAVEAKPARALAQLGLRALRESPGPEAGAHPAGS